MSALAHLLLAQGCSVSGSDVGTNTHTRVLEAQGARIFQGHDPSHLKGVAWVVASSAVPYENATLCAAREQQLPIWSRAQLLAWFMQHKHSIAVAGSHGKTTTTGWIAWLCQQAGWDPSMAIGGALLPERTHAHPGTGSWFVAEADESDGSLVELVPDVAVLTNIDSDHLEHHQGSWDNLLACFAQFVRQVPAQGCVIACCDDPAVRSVLTHAQAQVWTYGCDPQADVCVASVIPYGWGSRVRLVVRGEGVHALSVGLPGVHNALNATAAWCVGRVLGVPHLAAHLASFQGMARRFERHGPVLLPGGRTVTLMEDYGHHPTEVLATLITAHHVFPQRRLLWVFEPHRHSRLASHLSGFVGALQRAAQLWILPVHSAGERADQGATEHDLHNALRDAGHPNTRLAPSWSILKTSLLSHAQDGDVIMFQGAGNIHQWICAFKKEFV